MSRSWGWFGVLAAFALVSTSHPAAAGVSLQLEGGFGSSWVPAASSQPAASFYATIGFPTRAVRIAGEFGGTASFEPPTMRFPESPVPGDRSLTTFLVGLEAVSSSRARGPFAMAGAGAGHATLSGAKPGMEPFPGQPIPDRSVTDLAFGAGLGWRSMGGPGPLGFQFALRYHAVVHDGAIAGSATAITFGLAY